MTKDELIETDLNNFFYLKLTGLYSIFNLAFMNLVFHFNCLVLH